MKLVRRISLIAVVVVVVLVVGIYLAIDVIARNIIDSEGTSVLGVSTTIESVHLGVFTQDTTLGGLTIANPKGYARPNFIEVKSAEVKASVGVMLSSDIDIPLVHITGLVVDLEQVNQKLNASEIVDNVAANTASSDDTAKPISFNVKTLIIEDIQLTASGSIVNLAGGHLDTKIPRLELHNLGTKTDGDQLSEQLISLMLGVLMKHIAENPIHGLSGIATGAISTALERIQILKQTGAGQKVGEALNQVGRGLTGGLNEVGKGFQGIGAGLGGLIGEGEQAKPSGETGESDAEEGDSPPK
ncbi:MAG: hypothetical protein P8M32_04990 [Phycisphaerales bacterium]|nr:hypothetical protein [Phycisphaerales bacterium]